MRTVKVMVPVGAPDLSEVFAKPRDVEKARSVLSYLWWVRYTMRRDPSFAPGVDRDSGWVPVYAKEVKGFVHDYPRIVRALVSAGVIAPKLNERGGLSYLSGAYTSLYRFLGDGAGYRVEEISSPHVLAPLDKYFGRRYRGMRDGVLGVMDWYAPCVDFSESLYLDEDGLSGEELAFASSWNFGLLSYIVRGGYSGLVYDRLTLLDGDYSRLRGDCDLSVVGVRNCLAYFCGLYMRYPGVLKLLPEFGPLVGLLGGYSRNEDVGRFFVRAADGSLGGEFDFSMGDLESYVIKASAYGHRNEAEVYADRNKVRRGFEFAYPGVYDLFVRLKRRRRKDFPFVDKMYTLPLMVAQRLEVALLLDLVTKLAVSYGVRCVMLDGCWVVRTEDVRILEVAVSETFRKLGCQAPTLTVTELGDRHMIKSD